MESSQGVQLTVHDLGGAGPALLLVHATGFHGRVWAPCARHLPDRHCVAPDLRGHGTSELPEGASLAWDRFTDDVLAVVDDLGGGPLVAAGHSKGGALLLLAEQRRPGTFAALYLYEPIAIPPSLLGTRDGTNPLAEGALRRRERFDSFDAALANFAGKPPLNALHPDALDAYVAHGFAAQPDGSVVLRCRPEVESQVYQEGSRHEAFAHLAEVSCPVTVACGAVDAPFSPAQFAPAIADALPRGRLVRHPALGHFGPLEDPAAIAADIRTALG